MIHANDEQRDVFKQMTVTSYANGGVFCCLFVVSYFTNKYVLSVLKFTYPTVFQGWQMFVGGLLLFISGKLGLVEINRFPRSALISWFPGSMMFVWSIYAGSRALSILPIPVFLSLHGTSEVVSYAILKLVHKEQTSLLKLLSVSLLLVSTVTLPFADLQVDGGGYFWAVVHFLSVGGYRVFQKLPRHSHLSDLEQQCINYIFSVLLLAFAAQPTGDLFAVVNFPFLQSYKFQSGFCASAVLGFFLLLTTVKLKRSFSVEHCAAWVLVAKVMAACLSPFVFDIVVNKPVLCCLVLSSAGEALLIYSERTASDRD